MGSSCAGIRLSIGNFPHPFKRFAALGGRRWILPRMQCRALQGRYGVSRMIRGGDGPMAAFGRLDGTPELPLLASAPHRRKTLGSALQRWRCSPNRLDPTEQAKNGFAGHRCVFRRTLRGRISALRPNAERLIHHLDKPTSRLGLSRASRPKSDHASSLRCDCSGSAWR